VQDLLIALLDGPLLRFSEWPDPAIPKIAAGVYTIWNATSLVYVGMAGGAITPERVSKNPTGLRRRLKQHVDGRRSGDQFCVYVCDRYVVPQLSLEQLAKIGSGELSLDTMTKAYIHDQLAYRYVITPGAREARTLESYVRQGALNDQKPHLNPALVKTGRPTIQTMTATPPPTSPKTP